MRLDLDNSRALFRQVAGGGWIDNDPGELDHLIPLKTYSFIFYLDDIS
jgi:hypothetical protein